jgi:YggT family protein
MPILILGLYPLARVVHFIVNLYILIIIIRVILSWFPLQSQSNLTRIIYQLTEPILMRIRRFLPDLAGLDLSPMLLIIGLYLLENIIINILN